jgi:TRAP transporter TAXI family solute receptor
MSKIRKLLCLMCTLVIIMLVVIGCSTDTPNNTPEPAKPAEPTETEATETEINEVTTFSIEFATSVAGGGWATIGEGLAEAIRKTYPESDVTAIPSVPAENPVRVSIGDVPMALSEVTSVLEAEKGLEPYDQEYENIRVIGAVCENPLQFVITESSGINSFDDLKEKQFPLRVSYHSQQSLHEKSLEALFEGTGFTTEDIESWGGRIFYIGWGESCSMIKDGNLDAFGGPGIVPHSSTMELATSRDIKLLPVSPELAKVVNNKLGTVDAIIPAETYSFLEEDVPTISSLMILIASTDMSDDLAYSLAKSLHQQIDYLKDFHVSFKNISEDSIVKTGGLTLHPGAEKYYKDAGLIN